MIDALEYENHKSATDNEDISENLATKGVQFQNSFNKKGENYIKSQLTHDLAFPKLKTGGKLKRKLDKIGIIYPLAKKIKGPNLNSRCDNTTLTPCIYGQYLRRFCHLI